MLSTKRRVLILRSSLHYGGIERQLLDHARRLVAEGWRVDLVCCLRGEREHPLAPAAREQGLHVTTLHDPGPLHPAVWQQLRAWWGQRCARGERPDIVHSCDYRSDVLAWRVAGGRLPWVAESHGHTREGRAMRLWNACDRQALRQANAVVCVSYAWETSLAAMGVAADRLHVIGNTMAILAGEPLPAPAVLPAGRHFLFAGRLSPEKGVDWLLASWPQLSKRFPDLQLWVAGGMTGSGDFQRRVLAGLQQTNVHWLGFQTDIRPWLLAVSAVVVPSRQEAWGMTVFEALALGIPVVAAGVGGLPQLCRGAPHAILSTPGSVSSLLASLEAVLAPDFPRGPDLGLAYRSQSRFDPASRTREWLALYTHLLDRR